MQAVRAVWTENEEGFAPCEMKEGSGFLGPVSELDLACLIALACIPEFDMGRLGPMNREIFLRHFWDVHYRHP